MNTQQSRFIASLLALSTTAFVGLGLLLRVSRS